MSKPGALIKIGRQEHLVELQRKGLLYMKPLPEIWSIEDQGLRGDRNDGVASRYWGNRGMLAIEGEDVEIANFELRLPPKDADKINIFCMYMLTPLTYPIDARTNEFGDSALVFHKPQDLLDRICSEFKRQGVEGHADLVTYVPESYSGEIGPFKKLERYSWQSEWRVLTYGGEGQPRKIEIGDLSEYSRVCTTADLNSSFTVTMPIQEVLRLPG